MLALLRHGAAQNPSATPAHGSRGQPNSLKIVKEHTAHATVPAGVSEVSLITPLFEVKGICPPKRTPSSHAQVQESTGVLGRNKASSIPPLNQTRAAVQRFGGDHAHVMRTVARMYCAVKHRARHTHV
jgi:hypothetical protein